MKIVFAGGGSGGHIHPSIAVAKEIDGDFLFIISRSNLDKKVLSDSGFNFKQISSGKLRRYFDWQNFIDFFKFLFGIFQSFFILLKFKPNMIFCKGGFVALPVAIAGRILGISVILHESDSVMGLANRIISKFAKKVIWGIIEGNPIRFNGKLSSLKTKNDLGITSDKKILFIMGGSQGAKQINDLIEENFEKLKRDFFIVHLTGKRKKTKIKDKDYLQFEFLENNYFDYLNASDLIISRSGAGSIAEILFFKKPSIFIPLNLSASDHQRKNARIIEEKGIARYLDPENLNPKKFLEVVSSDFSEIENNLKNLKSENASKKIAKILEEF